MLKRISIARNMTVLPPESVTCVHVAIVLMTYPLIIWLIIIVLFMDRYKLKYLGKLARHS